MTTRVIKQQSMNRAEQLQWLKSLQSYLYREILSRVEPDQQRRLRLVDQAAMNIWAAAFTDESFAPNIGENYEELEQLGDAVLSTVFIRYLLSKYPGITRKQISGLEAGYMTKMVQQSLAAELHLNDHVRTIIGVNVHMMEDLFESLFGALYVVGDQAFGKGAGDAYCWNLLVSILANHTIDFNLTLGHPRTRVKELFEKLGAGQPEERWREANGSFTITLRQGQFEIFRRHNLPIQSRVLAEVRGTTRKNASTHAYEEALRRLNEIGATRSWAEQINARDVFSDPDLAPYYPQARERAREEGYTDMIFIIPRSGENENYVQLIGIDPGGKRHVLATAVAPAAGTARLEALRDYALQSRPRGSWKHGPPK